MQILNLKKISAYLFPQKAVQLGGGLLPVVATVGVVMVMAQGTIYYKAKTSARFLTSERNKVIAQQAAEAGIENGIADLGSRRVIVSEGMREQVTAQGVAVGAGTFTTTLSMVARGPISDTVDFNSTGQASGSSKSVSARLKLSNIIDTSRVVLSAAKSDTTKSIAPRTVYDTTITSTVKDPETMPIVNTTPAYAACMSSSAKKCDICHIPPGNFAARHVQSVSKSAIGTHVSHHGDYVTTDGTCDVYNPVIVTTINSRVVLDTVVTITVKITYDTVTTIDTVTKIRVLSWR